MNDDEGLQTAVLAELAWDAEANACRVGAVVEDGVATLTGHVRSLREHDAVLAAVRRIKGVRGLADEIEIRLPEDRRHHDDEIAKRALDILHWHLPDVSEGIVVKVTRGFVTLEGTVDRHHERVLAEQDVRRLGGVVGVANRLTVLLDSDTRDVREKILGAFRRHASVDAAGIDILRNGTRFVLTGQVRSWHERDLAEEAAWNAPGVTQIENRLVVMP